MRPVILILAALLFTPFNSVIAQEQPPPLEPGTRVRVTAPACVARGHAGRLEAVRSDTLVLSDPTLYCPLGFVDRLEVLRGQESQWLAGAGIGLVIGAVVGGIAGNELWKIDREGSHAGWIATGAGIVGVTTALVGAAVGAFIRSDRWEEVPLDRLRVSVVPRRDGRFGLGLSVRF